MKRYQLAKREGANWQVILVQDCETDIKLLTLECVRGGLNWGETNKRVMQLINETVNELESDRLKELTKRTLSNFAIKVYLQWASIYGTKTLGLMIIGVLGKKGISVPIEVKTKLNSLPNTPDFVYDRAVPNATYNLEYEKKVMERVNKVFEMQAKEDYSSKYSLRASIEREIRAEWQEKQLQDFVNKGVDLVWIDTHANCSERCQDWQGKLYSISGKSGTIDGISYQPLSNATDRYETTKAGKIYKNGTLSGFNCRHTIKPYKTGSKPNYIPSEVIDRQRELEKKQREYERTIRKYEASALGWRKNAKLSTDNIEKELAKNKYNHYKGLVDKWETEYIDFSRKNKIPFYPSRLKV
jgi:hypothetical protein